MGNLEILSTVNLESGNKTKWQAVLRQKSFSTKGSKQKVTFTGDFHRARPEHGVISTFSGLLLKTDWGDAIKIPYVKAEAQRRQVTSPGSHSWSLVNET